MNTNNNLGIDIHILRYRETTISDFDVILDRDEIVDFSRYAGLLMCNGSYDPTSFYVRDAYRNTNRYNIINALHSGIDTLYIRYDVLVDVIDLIIYHREIIKKIVILTIISRSSRYVVREEGRGLWIYGVGKQSYNVDGQTFYLYHNEDVDKLVDDVFLKDKLNKGV